MIREIVAWELQTADAMMFHADVDPDIFSEAAEFVAELQRQTQERVLVQALRLIVDGSPVGFVCNNTRDEFYQTELEHESQDELLCFLTTSSPIIDDFTARSNARCFYRFRERLYEELDVDDYGLPIAVSSPADSEDHTERWTRHIVDVKCEIYRLHPEEVGRNLRRNPVSLPPSQRSGPPAPPPMMRAISQWELTPVMVYYRDPDARDRLAQHVTLPPADTAVEGFRLIVEAEDAGYVALHVRSRFQFLLDVLAPVAPLSFTTTPHQDISIPVAERYFLLYRGRLYEVDERGYKDEGVGMEVIELGEDDALTLPTESGQQRHRQGRERIPDKVKMFVWQRDCGQCVRCGSNAKLEYDHIIPLAMGGSNTARNIQLLCESCNRSKGARLA